jgi:Flp pilus assembly protein TadG
MALVLPILLMLVFGIIQFGMVFAQKLALSNAAREAARLGVVQTPGEAPPTCGEIVDAARSRAQTVGMSGGSAVSVEIRQLDDVNSAPTGTPCSDSQDPTFLPCKDSGPTGAIAVTMKFTSSLAIPFSVFVDPLQLDGQGVYRCEYH